MVVEQAARLRNEVVTRVSRPGDREAASVHRARRLPVGSSLASCRASSLVARLLGRVLLGRGRHGDGRGGRGRQLELQVRRLAAERPQRSRGTSRRQAQSVRDEQSSSDRLACFHTTPTLVVTSLRTTTSLARDRPAAVAAAPDRVVARGDRRGSASPRETRQVQAGELIVRSCSTTSTSRPADGVLDLRRDGDVGVRRRCPRARRGPAPGWSASRSRRGPARLPFAVALADGVDDSVGSSVGVEDEDESALRRRRRRRRTTSRRCCRRAAVRSRTPAAAAVPRTMIRRIQ